MLPLALLLRARWPSSTREGAHIAVSGALIHGGYLAGCFAAVYHGMPAGMVALVVGLQPIVTAFAAAPLLNERVTALQWTGLALGFGGVMLVVWDKFAVEGLNGVSVAFALLALASITAGTVYQKRYCAKFDLRSGSVIQFSSALVLLLPIALFYETHEVRWSAELIFALAWLVIVLSVGAISLLYYLIEHGEASRVAALFFLTPLATAVMAYFLFGETLSGMAVAGMFIGIAGVALATRKPDVVTPEP